MIEPPRLIYVETAPQVVPDLNDAKTLNTTLPVVLWHGKQVGIKQVWLTYLKLRESNDSVEEMELRSCCNQILDQIQTSHPQYFECCLKEQQEGLL